MNDGVSDNEDIKLYKKQSLASPRFVWVAAGSGYALGFPLLCQVKLFRDLQIDRDIYFDINKTTKTEFILL